jgi:hypothetical protein
MRFKGFLKIYYTFSLYTCEKDRFSGIEKVRGQGAEETSLATVFLASPRAHQQME